MTRQEIKSVIGVALTMFDCLAKKTRTQADNLIVQVLKRNESKLAEAAEAALAESNGNPSEEQILEALKQVGIKL